MLNLFLLTLSLVPFADNVVTFLLFWEGMSVTSYFLVMTESDRRETRRAGLWYLAMTHGGLVLLMTAFLLLGASAPSTGFADLRNAADALPPAVRNAVFVLALLGFGSKAGVVPLHVWLPLAHPAAPSHVSALLSGVMIKMGVYGVRASRWTCSGAVRPGGAASSSPWVPSRRSLACCTRSWSTTSSGSSPTTPSRTSGSSSSASARG